MSYFPKLSKKIGTGTKSEVNKELEKMMYFALSSVMDATKIVLDEYATKEDTIKARVIEAALSALLHGNLRDSAITAGSSAERTRMQKATKTTQMEPTTGASSTAEGSGAILDGM